MKPPGRTTLFRMQRAAFLEAERIEISQDGRVQAKLLKAQMPSQVALRDDFAGIVRLIDAIMSDQLLLDMLQRRMEAIAQACVETVVVPPGVGCCGFAGDKGFTHPELNASALARLRSALPSACNAGYSNSRTCEIGLSVHGGIPYQSIVSLVDRCSQPARNRTELAKPDV